MRDFEALKFWDLDLEQGDLVWASAFPDSKICVGGPSKKCRLTGEALCGFRVFVPLVTVRIVVTFMSLFVTDSVVTAKVIFCQNKCVGFG